MLTVFAHIIPLPVTAIVLSMILNGLELTPSAAGAGLALGRQTADVHQAVIDAGLDDLLHHRVQADRGGDHERDALVPGGRLGGQAGDVLVPVLAGQQEVRGDDDAPRPSPHAVVEGGPDRGLGELHVGRLDEPLRAHLGELPDEVLEHAVGFLAP